MYDIICCIIFGFFMIIGVSNIIFSIVESFFRSDNFDNENLTVENVEYILRSSKYCNINYKVQEKNKNDKEMTFIKNKLNIT